MIIVMALDVLLREDGTVRDDRRALYEVLRTGGASTVLLAKDTDFAATSQMLARAKIPHDVLIVRPPEESDLLSWKVSAWRRMLGSSWRISYYLDTDAEACAAARRDGISTLLVESRVSLSEQAFNQQTSMASWDDVLNRG